MIVIGFEVGCKLNCSDNGCFLEDFVVQVNIVGYYNLYFVVECFYLLKFDYIMGDYRIF